jgi:CheY-like chemotaxis protein/REP element-mobilizing transposase RayT
MAISLLVITPTPGFGELMRETLRDSGRYRATLVASGEEAIAHATQTTFNAALLDADLEDVHPASLARSLRKILPDLRLIIISPQDGEGRAALDSVSPDAYLDKPFYFPDLLETVDRIMGVRTDLPPADHLAEPPMVVSPTDDKKKKPKPLVTPEPLSRQPAPKWKISPAPPWLEDVDRAAQYLMRLSLESAALAALITRRGALWAYAGQLPQPAAQELAQAVSQFWENDGGSDLARFIRLVSGGDELMLYATGLGADMVLALAFDAQTPFSKMRSQASNLARALSAPPPPESGKGERTPEASVPENLLDDLFSPPPTAPAEPTPPLPPEADMIPITLESPPSTFRTSETAPSFVETTTPTTFPGEDIPPLEAERETQVAQFPQNEPAFILQPIYPTLYQLAYACLLLPRMPGHHLIGDLSVRLNEWIPQLCLAFGWRLERLAIRPDFMQWVVSVGPNVSPAYLVKIIRRQTSQRIFSEFPRLAQENPSGDFWASGYLVMSGLQLPPTYIVKDFIAQTRRQQGIAP